jgi:hypothetical protein
MPQPVNMTQHSASRHGAEASYDGIGVPHCDVDWRRSTCIGGAFVSVYVAVQARHCGLTSQLQYADVCGRCGVSAGVTSTAA